MGRVIASTYEIIKELGSGGGGVVYEGKHLRLGKKVVLKADKRTPSAPPEVLRREVDTLKGLSHTRIPQVYDFVVEDGIVYTVMDYIEGESLDNPLKRKERFSQPQVIQWARQLLDALCYLHDRPPYGILHGDIKPSNIMLTPQGDVWLIDFNIALFLGEEGAVRVGYSLGYASPEHYGSSSGFDTEAPTEVMSEGKTELMTEAMSGVSGSSSRRGGLLDARSDIYSLGATLYHLLTGRRPAKEAREVQPLTGGDVSPAVAAIIQKAMALDPEERYQTASEMLYDFNHLWENDPRSIGFRHRAAVTATAMAAVFLLGGLSTFIGLKQMEQAQEQGRIAAEAAEKALAAVSASEEAYRGGDLPGAVHLALEALDSPHAVQAQKALTDALGIYDLSSGFKPFRRLNLPAAPAKAILSPEGTRAAAIARGRLLVFDTESGDLLTELAAEPSALADIVFMGENRILYAGDGALRAYDLTSEKEPWNGRPATGITLSADGSTAAAVYKEEDLATVYDAQTGELLRTVDFQGRHQSIVGEAFADPEDNLFALNGSGTRLAASFSDGSLTVFDLSGEGEDLVLFDNSPYIHFEGGFYGKYFAFSASGEGESVFAVVDVEAGEQTGGFSGPNPFHVQADEAGIYVSTENILVKLDPETGEQTERAYTGGDITTFVLDGNYTLTALDGSYAFFDAAARQVDQTKGRCDFISLSGEWVLVADRDTPALRILRLEDHSEARLFTYDSEYIHDEARISSGGNVILFRYDSFRLYGADGAILADVAVPDAEGVYDQQFRREEDCLEIIYHNGLIRRYSASDGTLLSETAGTPSDGSLDEEYLTDRFRVTAPLHGTPVVYDRKTGELLRELEPEANLTYVTELEDGLITEYITTEGERQGLLLNDACETLAKLPGLCDILPDGTLVFDDMRGNLRKSPIYSLEELIALAGVGG